MIGANDIAHAIQLAIAPVFLIVAVGAILNVLTARLARVVDRIRALEDRVASLSAGREEVAEELSALDRRIVRINLAITLSTLAVLLVCLVVMALFAAELAQIDLYEIIAGLFIIAMLVLIGALVNFLSEIRIAARTLRVSHTYRTRAGS
jgi:hypothetical protein